jgi:uncharacterized phage-associated protein
MLKLQKLLYYSDAWYRAFYNKDLFKDGFEAWVHGPVSRKIYARFAGTKNPKDLYSTVTGDDVRKDFDPKSIPTHIKLHIRSVLEVYNKFSGSELEEMTHNEEPWIIARGGIPANEKCTNLLDKAGTGKYYAKRLKKK